VFFIYFLRNRCAVAVAIAQAKEAIQCQNTFWQQGVFFYLFFKK
jgi:hypothetical protein